MEAVLGRLTRDDIEALADVLVDTTEFEAPADRMFAQGVRYAGLDTLQEHNFAEGVALSIKMTNELRTISPLDTLIA